MICPFCNKELSDSSQFCPKCGQEMPFDSSTVALSSFWEPVNKRSMEFEQECIEIAKQRANEAKAQQHKTILAVVALVIVMACTGLGIYIYLVVIPKESLSKAEVGSFISFGAYEQDNNTSNGKEKIEWLVLSKEEDSILAISKYALDCRQYDASSNSNETWDKSALRKWMNNTFIEEAFSPIEQKMIQSRNIAAENNPSYDTPPGNDTKDKVFLLSITEANSYFSTNELRKCKPTDYAISRGSTNKKSATWWLRTPGYIRYVTYVNYDGSICYEGVSVRSSDTAIRPALWIRLK